MPAMQCEFEEFAVDAERRLRRAYLGTVGVNRMPDAVAEALAYGWENWRRVRLMNNPVGYLYRVGQSRTRTPKRPQLPPVVPTRDPLEFEPGLPHALMALPDSQRTSVWLAHGCGWTHPEIAEVLDVSASTVSTHVQRGLDHLRSELGVDLHARS